MLQKQALWDWGLRQLQRKHAVEASSVGLGLQTVAKITCCRSKLCGTGASDSCRENMLQKQALWDWGFRQFQTEHAAEASSVRLGLQTVAETTCCRSKLCETGASDSSCKDNISQKQALRDWGFRQLRREHAAEASSVGLGLQTVAERTCCRSKLCGTGASDSCRVNMLQKQALWDLGFRQLQREHAAEASTVGLGLQTVAENMLQKQALWDWGFRQLQREHAAEASTVGLGLQTVAERTCCRSKLCGTWASDSCRENMLQKQALWDLGFRQLQREHAAEASSVGLGFQTTVFTLMQYYRIFFSVTFPALQWIAAIFLLSANNQASKSSQKGLINSNVGGLWSSKGNITTRLWNLEVS